MSLPTQSPPAASGDIADQPGADQQIAGPPVSSLDDVPGWLTHTDKILFRWFLQRDEPGDLLELGVFLGKTAIHIGAYLRPGEKFTVCDLFDLARDEETIRPGARRAYADLTQATFERNYLSFHDTLPAIIRDKTSAILDHVAPASCRFIHIDASHTYEDVRADLQAARQLLTPGGVVVFDDYRTEHTPGTAAAVWEAVANDGLNVICLSANRFYATWADPTPIQDRLIRWLKNRDDHRCDLQQVLGQRLVRVVRIRKPGGPGGQRQPATAADRSRPVWRRAAVAVLPPVLTEAVRRRRRRR